MSPTLIPGHVADQSAETLVPGKLQVALSRRSQIPAAVIPVAQVPDSTQRHWHPWLRIAREAAREMSGCPRGEHAR